MFPTLDPNAPGGPMHGVRVIDLTINFLGPCGTQLLADQGADVIKLESPGGDAMRQLGPMTTPAMGSIFLGFNRNKRSVELNLKDGRARDAFLRLCRTADVVVHNMRADATERLGIAYEDVTAVKPDIIYAYASGYARHGRKAAQPAYDDAIAAESGVLALSKRATGTPSYPPHASADKHSGYVLAASITTALFHRERTGVGQLVHVPMLETMVFYHLAEHLWEATGRKAGAKTGYERMMNRWPFPTRDGHIGVVAYLDTHWHALFEALGVPALKNHPNFGRLEVRVKNMTTLFETITPLFAAHTTAEWCEILTRADVPHGPVQDIEDILIIMLISIS